MPLTKEQQKELDSVLKMGEGIPSHSTFGKHMDTLIPALKGASCETLKTLDKDLGPVNGNMDEVQAAKASIAVIRDHKQCTKKGR